jgi:ATP/maltotriose-dependent transcriptional regulator MalT
MKRLSNVLELRVQRHGIDNSVAEVCPLTDRELQVVKLAATGLTNRRIAEKPRVAEPTIASHFISAW